MDEWVAEIEAAVAALKGKTEDHERRFMELQAEDLELNQLSAALLSLARVQHRIAAP